MLGLGRAFPPTLEPPRPRLTVWTILTILTNLTILSILTVCSFGRFGRFGRLFGALFFVRAAQTQI